MRCLSISVCLPCLRPAVRVELHSVLPLVVLGDTSRGHDSGRTDQVASSLSMANSATGMLRTPLFGTIVLVNAVACVLVLMMGFVPSNFG